MKLSIARVFLVAALLSTPLLLAVEGPDELRLKAEKGDADAQSKLGKMYATGEGVAKDPAAAVKWFRAAAEQGYASGQCGLGVMYATGEGVAKDLEHFLFI
jgi:TPR repeat protein